MRAIHSTLLLTALSIAAPQGAWAHAFLQRASPAVGSTVQHTPSEVVLSFTEDLEGAFSTIAVHNAQGASEQVGKSRVGPGKAQMHVGLKHLSPGTYTVIWHALSVDTHRTQGSFTFTVAR